MQWRKKHSSLPFPCVLSATVLHRGGSNLDGFIRHLLDTQICAKCGGGRKEGGTSIY